MRAGLIALLAMAAIVVLVGVASGSAPPKRAESARAPAPRTDQRAFPRTLSFWKCGPENEVARRDMIVGYAFCQLEYLRKRNPKGIFLLTPGFDPQRRRDRTRHARHIRLGSLALAAGLRVEGRRLRQAAGPRQPRVHARAFDFDWDYMCNADGSHGRASRTAPDAHRGWNIADPTDKGTSELVAKFFAYTAKLAGLYTKRWDGVFSDNWTYSAIGLDWAYGPKLDTDRDGKVDDYESCESAGTTG